MNNENNNIKIDKKDFEFVQNDLNILDSKLSTKPIGYYKDAWRRFKKNKASLVAACIILFLLLFSITVPFLAPFSLQLTDSKYISMVPKSNFLSKMGIATGIKDADNNERGFYYDLSIGAGAQDIDGSKYNHASIIKQNEGSPNWKNTGNISFEDGIGTKFAAVMSEPKIEVVKKSDVYFYDLDTYNKVGFIKLSTTITELEKIMQFEKDNDIKILYPLIDEKNLAAIYMSDANYWYLLEGNLNKPVLDPYGNFISNYLLDEQGRPIYHTVAGSTVNARVLYKNYFVYKNGAEPVFFLGTNPQGQDLLIRLAIGIRTSLMLAIAVVTINLILGAIYGSIEGYYGGTTDMIMERVREILNGIPFIIIVMLFKLHLVDTGKVSPLVAMIFAFITLGWIGSAGLIRRQFYRYKRQEYVLAARTLGARDRRIMTKHIFPNAIGTIITSTVLAVPSFIFSESMLSYLGILNISGRNAASLGAMLSSGQEVLQYFPHVILWPAIVISLLMISFNLFGNGLRDAFNPTLRGGAEE